jgi:hypothetical protein
MRKLAILFTMIILLGTTYTTTAEARGFSDVLTSYGFYDEINYLAERNIINGVDATNFAPDNIVTRGDAALMIARALNLDTTQQATVFSDVSKDKKASGAIQSAYKAGIIKGYTDGRFGIGDKVKRGDMAIFIARAFNLEDEATLTFSDVRLGTASFSSIRKASAAGIVNGVSKDKFEPDSSVTRGQLSAFLARALNDELRLPVYACGYNPESKVNPDKQTINCLITKGARNAEVPPEIVKAVASVETGWVQYLPNGEPNISTDNGIGIMQITTTDGYDVERLKYDINYNIEVGIEMLVKNFNRSDLPKVADHNPKSLESWYFAVMAYNGTKAANSPIFQATGERNLGAYQEKVYKKISDNGLLPTNISSIEMNKNDFTYESNNNIKFNKMNFTLSTNATSTNELLRENAQVKYNTNKIRKLPTINSEEIKVTPGTTMTIIGEPVYDQNPSSHNQFVWYPAMITGTSTYGYITSSNIK